MRGVVLAEQLKGHVLEAFVSPHANHVLQRHGIRRSKGSVHDILYIDIYIYNKKFIIYICMYIYICV